MAAGCDNGSIVSRTLAFVGQKPTDPEIKGRFRRKMVERHGTTVGVAETVLMVRALSSRQGAFSREAPITKRFGFALISRTVMAALASRLRAMRDNRARLLAGGRLGFHRCGSPD